MCPELIENGYIYAIIPPLYKITIGSRGDKYKYLKDDQELTEYREAHKGEKYTVSRFKGLGEQDAEELEETLLNEDTRNIKQIILDDFEATDDLFKKLMGDNIQARKDYILAHAEEVEINI